MRAAVICPQSPGANHESIRKCRFATEKATLKIDQRRENNKMRLKCSSFVHRGDKFRSPEPTR